MTWTLTNPVEEVGKGAGNSQTALRLLALLSIVLLVALVPVYLHDYAGQVNRDGIAAAEFLRDVPGYASFPTERPKGWGTSRFGTQNWAEREFRSDNLNATVTVVRSFDPKSLYHKPELAITRGATFHSRSTTRPSQHPDLPIHVLRDSDRPIAAAGYILLFGDTGVEHPIRYQILNSWRLLASPRRPVTLVFGQVTASSENVDALEALTDLLISLVETSGPDQSGSLPRSELTGG